MAAYSNILKLSFLASLLSGLWPVEETRQHDTNLAVFPPTCNRIECPVFEIVHVGNGYEIRRYNSTMWASTSPIQDISLVEATRTGFLQGGQWNSGGRCHKETEPIFNKTYLGKYTSKMRTVDSVLREMKTPVIYLNISRLTDYRKDGHPSIYRMRYKSEEEQIAAVKSQDCSHWCLPGVPDTWNELLYASLLRIKWGSWSK